MAAPSAAPGRLAHRAGRRRLRLALIAGVLGWLLAGLLGFSIERRRILAGAEAEADARADTVALDLRAAIEPDLRHAAFLAAVLSHHLRDDETTADRLSDSLGAFPDLLQARVLDLDGQERVRFDRLDGRPHRAYRLQNKSHRYYFAAARRRPAGQVYVSRLDLNMEHGRVQEPWLPVVRFAAPIPDAEGTPAALLVLNRDARPLLAEVARWRARSPGQLWLVDAAGDLLSHPDPQQSFRVQRGAHPALAALAPAHVDWVRGATRAEVRRADGEVVAVAPLQVFDGVPRVVVVEHEGEVLLSRASAFIPLAIALAAAGVAGLALLVVARRRLRQVEERAAAVAAAKATALTEAAAALAHEVRNPLAAIVNSAGLLQAEATADPDSLELLEIVRSESARLERTLDDFVGLARPPPTRRAELELAGLAREVVRLARADPRFTDGVRLELEAPLAVHVDADGDQVRQVLWNLLRNAGDAVARVGGHSVRVAVGEDDDGARWLAVEDDGPGPPGLADDRRGPARGGLGLIVATGVAARNGARLELGPRAGAVRGTLARLRWPPEGEEVA